MYKFSKNMLFSNSQDIYYKLNFKTRCRIRLVQNGITVFNFTLQLYCISWHNRNLFVTVLSWFQSFMKENYVCEKSIDKVNGILYINGYGNSGNITIFIYYHKTNPNFICKIWSQLLDSIVDSPNPHDFNSAY